MSKRDISTTGTATIAMSYAGFLPRLYAAVIDAVIIGILEGLSVLPLILLAQLSPAIYIVFSLLPFIVAGAYFVFFESSRFQATPGKMFFGLKVTDLRGDRISLKRGAIKIAAQYLLYGLIFVASLVSAALFIAPDMKSDFRSVPSSSQFTLIILPALASIFVGNLLYFCCFVLLVFSDRKQTVFDRLTGRLVWSSRPESESSRDVFSGFLGCFVFVTASAFLFALFKITTHTNFEDGDLIRAVLYGFLGYVAVIFLTGQLVAFDFLRMDPYSFVLHARFLACLLVGRRRKLWLDRAAAMLKYAQGDAKAADAVLLAPQGKLTEREMSGQLQLRLIGCSIACNNDGIIDTGLQMKQRQKFHLANRLLVANTLFRCRRYKEALELLESISNPRGVNPKTFNANFASFYARTGCEKELAKTLIWLEKQKYPLTNEWRLRIQGVCEAAKGNTQKARNSLKDSLSQFAYPVADPRKPAFVVATMSVRRLKEDLAELDEQEEDEIIDLSPYRRQLKQIAKRLDAAGEADI